MDERESNMIRLGCLRDAVATVDIEQRNGFFKTKDNTEDVPTRINLYYQKYLELISEGKPRPEGFQTPQKPVESSIQPQIVPKKDEPLKFTPVKRDTGVACNDCGQQLTKGELTFVKKNDTENLCYPCEKKRKALE